MWMEMIDILQMMSFLLLFSSRLRLENHQILLEKLAENGWKTIPKFAIFVWIFSHLPVATLFRGMIWAKCDFFTYVTQGGYGPKPVFKRY